MQWKWAKKGVCRIQELLYIKKRTLVHPKGMFLIVGCQETQQWGDAAGPDSVTALRLHMQEGLRDPRGVCQGNGKG